MSSKLAARSFKGIICDDISEFESSHPSHAVSLCGLCSRDRIWGCRTRPGLSDPGVTATLEAAIGIFEFGTGEVRFVSGSGVFVNDGGRQHSGLGLFNRALHYWESFFQR
jgi:hypothetical protein